MPHIPVLLNKVLELLDPKTGETAVDGTLGGGGHSEAILQKVGGTGFLLSIDADPQAVQIFNAKKRKTKNAKAVVGNFKDMKALASENGVDGADLVLLDIGLSSNQLDQSQRGFSFQKSGPLDMRFDQSTDLRSAADLVNELPEKDLAQIFKSYGEEKNAKKIARTIIIQRKKEPILTTDALFEIIKQSLPAKLRFKAGDTARRIFQALRIAVNDELESLKGGLTQGFELLKPGGRMAVISFHSLEDRIVKQFFAEVSKRCKCPPEFPVCVCGAEAKAELLTSKPVTADASETETNPRSKSAKLRAIKKIR